MSSSELENVKKKHTRTPPPIRGGGVSNTLPRVIIMPCWASVKPGTGAGLLPLAFIALDLVIDRTVDEAVYTLALRGCMSFNNIFLPFKNIQCNTLIVFSIIFILCLCCCFSHLITFFQRNNSIGTALAQVYNLHNYTCASFAVSPIDILAQVLYNIITSRERTKRIPSVGKTRTGLTPISPKKQAVAGKRIFQVGMSRKKLTPPVMAERIYIMSTTEISSKIKELRELQALIEEAQAEADALKDEIKAYMGDSEELYAGEYKVTWKPVESSRIDTAALKKALPELAAQFTKTATTRRFCIA